MCYYPTPMYLQMMLYMLNNSCIPTNLNWKLYVLGNKYSSTWATSYSYGLGKVKYGGIIYKCMKLHVSSVFEDDILNWERFYEGQNYLGAWTYATDYKINDPQ